MKNAKEILKKLIDLQKKDLVIGDMKKASF